MVTGIGLECRKGFICGGVIRQCFVNGWFGINSREPFRHMGNHLVHVLLAGAEHDVLAAFVCNVAGKDLVQSVRLLQGAL